MQQRDNLLCKIKKYIDESLNPKKCNLFDSSKNDYQQTTDKIYMKMNIMKLFTSRTIVDVPLSKDL